MVFYNVFLMIFSFPGIERGRGALREAPGVQRLAPHDGPRAPRIAQDRRPRRPFGGEKGSLPSLFFDFFNFFRQMYLYLFFLFSFTSFPPFKVSLVDPLASRPFRSFS